MQINMNAALRVSRQITQTSSMISKSLERLSSGKRVNKPKDDPAAIAQINSLDSSIRGTSQATRNLNDGMGLLQTADSAIQTQLDIVQKMRELAVQGANGTLTSADRTALSSQITQLMNEFARISQDTEFNGQKLLDGTFGTKSLQVGASSTNKYDMTIGNLSASSAFLRTVGSGSFTRNSTLSTGTSPTGVQAADLNNDGHMDLIGTDNSAKFIYLGNGDGTFGARKTALAGAAFAIKDVNKDGVKDLLSYNNATSIGIFIGNGDGTFKNSVTYAAGSSVGGGAIGDINQDGNEDLVVTDGTDTYFSIYLGNGDGSFKARTTMSAGSATAGVQIADFNGDGTNDIVTTTFGTSSVSVFSNLGLGNFGTATTLAAGSLPLSVSIADLNGDGAQDIVATDLFATADYVYLNNGNGSFASGVSYSFGGAAPYFASLSDYNGDGSIDIATVLPGNGVIAVSLNSGSGTFTTGATISMGGTGQSGLTAADFNEDGAVDLMTGDGGFGNTATLYTGNTVRRYSGADISLSTQAKAQQFLKIADTAITSLKNEQTNIARLLRRVESSTSSNDSFSESYQQAKEVREGTDIAMETAELTRNQILQQAQVAALAQANSNAQVVLGLLRDF